MGIYLDKYKEYSDAKTDKMDPKYDHINLTLDTHRYR